MINVKASRIILALFAVLSFSSAAIAQTVSVDLKGASEVPANNSTASGTGSISVAADKSVSGKITTTGIEGKMAHIHTGVAGANGPVLVGLTKDGDNGWTVPAGAKFTDEQYAAYMAGGLYVNVHTAAHPGGEIRGQLLPK
ncbi:MULTISPECIES: CHRD domain-containing protein [unclassified Herbaspirillum]|uniref:CHRD domain-containing protein n=1 Tax=unclassified Herbaspirillum TaxID=2624150 RepID=UPI000E2EAE0A|nr:MULTISPECIES: CHRD domain-containing protein [unclassified Herbaspirillum]RFB68647.1 CHRD domain-containing protein [Herbaspirillum sp. 3R-3a1]TFI05553.1 CHRD domain-containing protein [Herbaspirillum sp. 3R11]TFI13537.1 CHRD domain-containing protein [Herbaspirillum sp. 3R-11]TFI23266.1 CHRD domain-containing protein [Herbaspirillum sp. 3C11]